MGVFIIEIKSKFLIITLILTFLFMVGSVYAAELNNTDYPTPTDSSNNVLEITNGEEINSDSQEALYLSGSVNTDYNTGKINNVSVDNNENILQSSDENNILAGSTVDVKGVSLLSAGASPAHRITTGVFCGTLSPISSSVQ